MTAEQRTPLLGRLTSGQWLAAGSGALAFVALAAIVLSLVAFDRQVDQRKRIVDRFSPAEATAERLLASLVSQDTGIRGYALTRREAFLPPFDAGERTAADALTDLRRLVDPLDAPEIDARLDRTTRVIAAWRDDVVLPTLASVRRGRAPATGREEADAAFAGVRAEVVALEREIQRIRAQEVEELWDATDFTRMCLIAAGILFLLSTLAVWLTLRRAVGIPLSRLAAASRKIALGQHQLAIEPGGSRDVRELTADIEAMRRQIVRELAALERTREQLEEQAADLQRSNEELEQFAYVASHDLQEPLRKVASFCQMLERRYSGQLDERGQQYIDFAVDGAKRMQVLINDLLAFSRVGRVGAHEFAEVDLQEVLDEALSNLAGPIEDTGAAVEVRGTLPRVRGDAALLAGVFQNLVANAVKFRGDAPPRVTVTTTTEDGDWRIDVEDNGIGIDPEYADRIFVIFQRLHAKDAYPGTGIGLAMTRKIIEYHGGRIWLEPSDGSGARFAFTLPGPERPAAA